MAIRSTDSAKHLHCHEPALSQASQVCGCQMLQQGSYTLLIRQCMLAQEPEYVFIVGTVHFSERSAEDAAAIIQVCKLPITCRHCESILCCNVPKGTGMAIEHQISSIAHVSTLVQVYVYRIT